MRASARNNGRQALAIFFGLGIGCGYPNL